MKDETALTSQRYEADDNAKMEKARSLIFEVIKAHESSPTHKGEPCGMNRMSVIAWFAHSLGISSTHVEKLMTVIAHYEKDCPCGVPTLKEEHFKGHKE